MCLKTFYYVSGVARFPAKVAYRVAIMSQRLWLKKPRVFIKRLGADIIVFKVEETIATFSAIANYPLRNRLGLSALYDFDDI